MNFNHVSRTLRLVASILEASKEDALKSKHPALADDIDKLVEADPSGSNKYIEWQVKQLLKKEPVEEVASLTKTFHQMVSRLEKKDINSYPTLGSLRGAIEALGRSKQELRVEKKGTHEYLLNTEDMLVVHPIDMAASCFFGKGAKWCISAELSENYFDSYSSSNDYFYFVVDKNATPNTRWSKVAVQLRKGRKKPTFWDAEDNNVSIQTVKNEFGIPVSEWMPVILKRHQKQGDTVAYRIKNGQITKLSQIKSPLSPKLKVMLAENSDDKETLATLAGDKNEWVRRAVAKNTATPPDMLTKLAGDKDEVTRIYVAKNTSTPPDVLTKLAGDKYEEVRYYVAKNTATPPDMLTKLAGDKDEVTRIFVAENTATPPAVLKKLADDKDEQVRRYVAENTATPPAVLKKLADDEDRDVRRAVAENTSTPPDVLTKLAGDKDVVVRRYVAENKSTPPAVLTKLAGDKYNDVRRYAAENPAAPPDALKKLAGDKASGIRSYVAEHTSTPPDVLTKLSKDEDYDVRQSVAKNTSTPPDVLARMASDDEDSLARRYAAYNLKWRSRS
jgi:uncharacterized protein (DUF2336 family)/transcriptional regulator with XRE-family HTH domain